MPNPTCPTYVARNPIVKQIGAYSPSSKPKTTNDVVAVKLVKRIMHADDADATAGWTSIASIKGPFTMPPPTPNMPAKKPAKQHMKGYTIVARLSHFMSPSTY
mmetsp:Transcript_94123/g.141022  ORF Transcript_94123/g.141022 Transcript_94123/m.141022 type:complete len:103 (+) Transcript_94123:318-626(+)